MPLLENLKFPGHQHKVWPLFLRLDVTLVSIFIIKWTYVVVIVEIGIQIGDRIKSQHDGSEKVVGVKSIFS